MGEKINQGNLYFRKKESWFKELLYKIKILKPKYKEVGKIKEINIEGVNKIWEDIQIKK